MDLSASSHDDTFVFLLYPNKEYYCVTSVWLGTGQNTAHYYFDIRRNRTGYSYEHNQKNVPGSIRHAQQRVRNKYRYRGNTLEGINPKTAYTAASGTHQTSVNQSPPYGIFFTAERRYGTTVPFTLPQLKENSPTLCDVNSVNFYRVFETVHGSNLYAIRFKYVFNILEAYSQCEICFISIKSLLI